ncbi:unnamed protein product [Brassicogethes aeneus]|uniref:[histone H3]-lysine(36) N-trimethyltransferase n=1 Tax=Brassicogethes aeneus TaxID=1431903 RepID=A0A9P0FJP0_BRAAE|nr:unnamed protein product [Brassicogethes aeneus]
MPPKRKPAIVVGTVSTRSTARQSVVNIEIPRSRSKRGRKPRNRIEFEVEVDVEEVQSVPEASQVVKEILDEWSEKENDTEASESEDLSLNESKLDLSLDEGSQSSSVPEITVEVITVDENEFIIQEDATEEPPEVFVECSTDDVVSNNGSEYSDAKDTVDPIEEGKDENTNSMPKSESCEAISEEKQEIEETTSSQNSEEAPEIEEMVVDEEIQDQPETEEMLVQEENIEEENSQQQVEEMVVQVENVEEENSGQQADEMVYEEKRKDLVDEELVEESMKNISLNEEVSSSNIQEVEETEINEDPVNQENEELSEESNKNEDIFDDSKEQEEINIVQSILEQNEEDEEIDDTKSENIEITPESKNQGSEEIKDSVELELENTVFYEDTPKIKESNKEETEKEEEKEEDPGEISDDIDKIRELVNQDLTMEKETVEEDKNEDTNEENENKEMEIKEMLEENEVELEPLKNEEKDTQIEDQLQKMEEDESPKEDEREEMVEEILKGVKLKLESSEKKTKKKQKESPKKTPKKSEAAEKKSPKAKKTPNEKATKKTTPKVAKPKVVKEKKEKTPKESRSGKKYKKKVDKKEEDIKNKDEEESNEIRRSSRIKSITVLKKKTKGHGLVKSKSEQSFLDGDVSENSNSGFTDSERSTPSASPMPKERSLGKTRWSKSTENLADKEVSPMDINLSNVKPKEEQDEQVKLRLKQFVHLKENLFLTDRLSCKEAKKMACDCFLTEEEMEEGEYGCGDDCLNRLLMIECGNQCPVNDRCTNKRFQKVQFAPVEVFNTQKKGLGLRAAANIPYGEFILEYVGEVLDPDEFEKRAEHYSTDKNIHYYFMSLRADAIIDATMKGNISRFINHSCDPNAETQKWTVNGELRIGFFSTRTILAGEEITFDYRFQRYGKEAQKCYCEAATCRGWLGERPDSSDDEDDEEDEETEAKVEDADVTITESDEAMDSSIADVKLEDSKSEVVATPAKKVPRRKPRKEMFEDMDQLEEEIDTLMESGLKNQAHTLKLSRLMVRAKEISQRAKLLRVLRRGELPCRRLFLDYHGLRLMHGYMIDAQLSGKTFEQIRLEMLQTLAMLPIPNKTMLQDSKVLSTVANWASGKGVTSPDSDSNSPQDQDVNKTKTDEEDNTNYGEEIVALASKLLEEWSNLKEVFRIPKKERIEQMKEHEREANKKYMLNAEQDVEKSRSTSRYLGKSNPKVEKEIFKKKMDERERVLSMYKITKIERRKLFALQVELKEEERRRKQREQWREHERNCILIGADPRLTAPFDPSRGFQYVWNSAIGQWQNIPIPAETPMFRGPNINVPPPHMPPPKPVVPAYSYAMPLPQLPYQATPPPTTIPPPLPYQTPPPLPMTAPVDKAKDEVKFMGPIPPPVKLPPKWKTAKDKYGRPYYYHVKIRKSQWEPPAPSNDDDMSESSSSTESSSLSSDSSSDNSDSEDDVDDTRLLLQVRKQMEKSAKLTFNKSAIPQHVRGDSSVTPSPDNADEEKDEDKMDFNGDVDDDDDDSDKLTSIDIRLKEQFDFMNEERPPPTKKRRVGLVQERIISPRTEEDRLQFREDLKRYKYNKEKLKREKEIMQQQQQLAAKSKPRVEVVEVKKARVEVVEIKKPKEKKPRTAKAKIREMSDFNSEAAKKIKETFRSNMAHTVVSVLNAYRKPECKEARITNTEDFKHLARKLTHFVMLKEMKHISKIEDLTCTDNVKSKAREYIKKYMSKFGETYQKRADEPDFKD